MHQQSPSPQPLRPGSAGGAEDEDDEDLTQPSPETAARLLAAQQKARRQAEEARRDAVAPVLGQRGQDKPPTRPVAGAAAGTAQQQPQVSGPRQPSAEPAQQKPVRQVQLQLQLQPRAQQQEPQGRGAGPRPAAVPGEPKWRSMSKGPLDDFLQPQPSRALFSSTPAASNNGSKPSQPSGNAKGAGWGQLGPSTLPSRQQSSVPFSAAPGAGVGAGNSNGGGRNGQPGHKYQGELRGVVASFVCGPLQSICVPHLPATPPPWPPLCLSADVVRGNKRQELQGWACKQCQDWYDAMKSWDGPNPMGMPECGHVASGECMVSHICALRRGPCMIAPFCLRECQASLQHWGSPGVMQAGISCRSHSSRSQTT